MDNRLKRAPGVYLTGFMGSGKTTVARLLADRLGWDFADVDAEIEAREHLTVAEIFEQRGEAEFRRIEHGVIAHIAKSVERGAPCVVALGGGSFIQANTAELLENHGISVWLDCPIETIERRIAMETDHRPLARDREAMHRLYDERRAGYSRAHYAVDANCEVESAVEKILALPFWK